MKTLNVPLLNHLSIGLCRAALIASVKMLIRIRKSVSDWERKIWRGIGEGDIEERDM